MCTKTDHLPVVTLSHFIADNFGLVLLPLEQFLEQVRFSLARHKAAYYTILFCEEGNGTIRVDTNTIDVAKNIALCIKPNSVIDTSTRQDMQGFAILFSEDFFSLRYNDNVLRNFGCLKYHDICRKQLNNETATEWSFYRKVIQREYTQGGRHALNLLRSYLNIILNTLDNGEALIPLPSVINEKERKAAAFEQLLDVHFAENKFPSFYAGKLFITVNYLNRICKERRGLSSGMMIRKRVMLEAERLLYHTSRTVSEVSADLGFENISYFTTFFKKHNGMSPESFRRKMS